MFSIAKYLVIDEKRPMQDQPDFEGEIRPTCSPSFQHVGTDATPLLIITPESYLGPKLVKSGPERSFGRMMVEVSFPT